MKSLNLPSAVRGSVDTAHLCSLSEDWALADLHVQRLKSSALFCFQTNWMKSEETFGITVLYLGYFLTCCVEAFCHQNLVKIQSSIFQATCLQSIPSEYFSDYATFKMVIVYMAFSSQDNQQIKTYIKSAMKLEKTIHFYTECAQFIVHYKINLSSKYEKNLLFFWLSFLAEFSNVFYFSIHHWICNTIEYAILKMKQFWSLVKWFYLFI